MSSPFWSTHFCCFFNFSLNDWIYFDFILLKLGLVELHQNKARFWNYSIEKSSPPWFKSPSKATPPEFRLSELIGWTYYRHAIATNNRFVFFFSPEHLIFDYRRAVRRFSANMTINASKQNYQPCLQVLIQTYEKKQTTTKKLNPKNGTKEEKLLVTPPWIHKSW